MSYPLEDIKVLDMSRVLAGPFAGRMLCDLGADLVKLEPPEGDLSRLWGAQMNGQSGCFNQHNAGKRGIAVDLATADGVALVKRLVAEADILLENFRGGIMERFGLGWADLQPINPKLIMCSISGFGQVGPESARAAYAPVIHAEAGLVARQSRTNATPLADIVLPLADTNSSLHGLIAVLAALHMRERTGKGQHLDIAMFDVTLFTDPDLHYELDTAEAMQPSPSEIWPTAQSHLMVAGDFRYIWRRLLECDCVRNPAIGKASLTEKIKMRRQIVGDYFLSFKVLKDLTTQLDAMKIVWGEVRSSKELCKSPTALHRQSIVEISDGAAGKRLVPQSPYRFSDAESGVRGPSPCMGEHNHEVLSDWLNLDADEIRKLEADKVLISFASSE